MANKKGKNIAIDEKQTRLLLTSKIIKDYIWLENLLKEKSKLTKKDIEQLPFDKQTLLNSTWYKDLYRQACAELEYKSYAIMDDKSKWKKCYLCDEPNKYINYFENIHTHQKINMGNDCRDNYKVLDGKDRKTIEEIQQQGIELSKKSILNEKLPGIVERMDNVNTYLPQLRTFINKNLLEKFNKSINQVNDNYEDWKKSKQPTETLISKIKNSVNEAEKVMREINANVQNQKLNEFNITVDIYNWVKRHGDSTLTNFLQEDEVITWRSACRILEPNLMKKIMRKFITEFNKIGLLYKGIDTLNKRFVLSINNNGIEISIEYLTFIQEFGGFIFKNENNVLTIEYIKNNSNISSAKSLSTATRLIFNLLGRSRFDLIDEDDSDSSVVFMNKLLDKVFIVDMREFTDNFKSVIFNKEEPKKEDLVNYILLKSKKQYTIKEYKEWQEELKEFRKI